MGVTITATVSPAKAGFQVELWWLTPSGTWALLEPGTTDAAGEKIWLYNFTSYPQTVRVNLPWGQVIEGKGYGGYLTDEVTLYDEQEVDFDLYPEPFPPEIGITVFIDPPYDNASLELRYRSYGLDALLFTQQAANGMVFWPASAFTDYDVFSVRFPPQTLNGIPYLEASTSLFSFSSAPLERTLTLEEGPLTSKTVTIGGICRGGDPIPSMLLELYDNDVRIDSFDFGMIVIDTLYDLETVVIGAGIHSVYGRMVLTNTAGSYEWTTPTEEFELG